MADKINVLIPEETVDAKIKEIGEQISKDYAGKEVHLICILKGGVFFACELAKRITVPVSLDFMQVSSYGDATESSGIVRIKKDLDDTMENKEVIIVEDIIDSGRTLHYLIPVLKQRNPKSIRLCALLNKPDRREVEVQIDYLGFDIPDEFVIGYGLDYAQKYRNLPFIGVVEPEAAEDAEEGAEQASGKRKETMLNRNMRNTAILLVVFLAVYMFGNYFAEESDVGERQQFVFLRKTGVRYCKE